MTTQTVGELKKLLEGYSDDLFVTFLDDEGNYDAPIEVVGVKTLGVFSRGGSLPYFRDTRFLQSEVWIEDKEVLVLG